MRLRKVASGCVALLFLAVVVVAQNGTTPPAQSPDSFDQAHKDLLQSSSDKAVDAGKLTDAISKSLPVGDGGPIVRRNYVDEQIFGRMERDGIPHAPLATDEEFLRRVYLDATGLPPTPAAVREFLASKDANKRDNVIDSLIGTDAFADQWAWMWMDLFQSIDQDFNYWFKQGLKLDRPYNEVFAEIAGVGASKTHNSIPAWGATAKMANYSNRCVTRLPAQDQLTRFNRLDFIDASAVLFGRVFMGVNLECISCHDGAGHLEPLNMWLADKTRADFAKQSAFWGSVRSLSISQGRSDVGAAYNGGDDLPYYTPSEARFPRDGAVYQPAFIMTGEKPRPGLNPRQEMGRIIPEDIQFSRATVNLIWGKLMNAAFVEPYDGFDLLRLDPNNPPPAPWTLQPTNAWLLDAMAKDFKANNFSLHHLMKTIMKSSAYQLSTSFPGEWKDSFAPYYARRYVRVLGGAEIIDTLAQVTERPMPDFRIQGHDVTRVKQLANPATVSPTGGDGGQSNLFNEGTLQGNSIKALMQSFFQTLRETPPTFVNNASAVQAMMMMISPVVKERVLAKSDSGVQRLLQSGKTDSQIIEDLYVQTLSRFPTAGETEVNVRILNEGNRQEKLEDIQWALLNTAEFLLNH